MEDIKVSTKAKKEKKVLNDDPKFIPQSINDIGIEFIMNYCVANKQQQWLKDLINERVSTDKNGKERRISFIEIRKEFAKKFFTSIAPKPMNKKPSMYDRISQL